ncbi:uncharacterized protein IL334_006897 [Kwoniella shivajii]|uniref:Uncharacterized protein n=1 Tax=Kwoniella shivajii TaxID=564305 RepID=A0ABZ1DAB5_9TREE|nr:hypothetical protein IL334_006897 [Kwoniella shivajii]
MASASAWTQQLFTNDSPDLAKAIQGLLDAADHMRTTTGSSPGPIDVVSYFNDVKYRLSRPNEDAVDVTQISSLPLFDFDLNLPDFDFSFMGTDATGDVTQTGWEGDTWGLI